jgi:hypothetical protein
MVDHMKELALRSALLLLLTIALITPFSVEAGTYSKYAAVYPAVQISGKGTLTSNITGSSVSVSFSLEGTFWIEENVNIPKLNVSGRAMVYNVTGTFTVEGKSKEVTGVFSNITFEYPGLSGNFFAINVANTTTAPLMFNGLAPLTLLKETWGKPSQNFIIKYTPKLPIGDTVAALVDSEYPADFFLTKPPRLLSVTIVFPKTVGIVP